MPCNCCGFRAEKCNCKVLGTGYQCDDGEVTLLAHSKSICPFLESKLPGRRTTNFVYKIVELLYEKCAAYNLRYCRIGGFTKRDSYFCNTLKDFLILLCFLVANFVVFLAIFFKTVVHLYYVLTASAQWLGRSLTTKVDANKSPVMLRSSAQPPKYKAPFSYKYPSFSYVYTK